MKLLLYCTKAKPILRDYRGKAIYNRFVISPTDRPFTSDDTQPILNGKIVGECDFEVEEIETYNNNQIYEGCRIHTINTYNISKLLELSCLNQKQLDDYLGENNGYAIHIKNLKIFDKPRELSDYTYFRTKLFGTLGNAPQNMMYAYDGEEKKVLISIRPEWLCKILNGEKTIEVRKKVLKEMIK